MMTAGKYKILYNLTQEALNDTSDSQGAFYTKNWNHGVYSRDRELLHLAGDVAHERYMALKFPNHKSYPDKVW